MSSELTQLLSVAVVISFVALLTGLVTGGRDD